MAGGYSAGAEGEGRSSLLSGSLMFSVEILTDSQREHSTGGHCRKSSREVEETKSPGWRSKVCAHAPWPDRL